MIGVSVILLAWGMQGWLLRKFQRDSAWLEEGPGAIEKAVADIVNEVLVMRGIHCRTSCVIEPRFAPVDAVELAELPPWPRHRAVYQEFLRRRREGRFAASFALISFCVALGNAHCALWFHSWLVSSRGSCGA